MPDIKHWFTFRPWQRHGLVLMVGGLVYIFIGLSAVVPVELSERQRISMVVALNIMPIESWALVFISVGVLACLSSKWPAFETHWGYVVMTGLASGWAAMYFIGYIFGYAPSSNITHGLVWALVAFMWWAISGLMNPIRVERELTNGID